VTKPCKVEEPTIVPVIEKQATAKSGGKGSGAVKSFPKDNETARTTAAKRKAPKVSLTCIKLV
jgi:hypothetical protein